MQGFTSEEDEPIIRNNANADFVQFTDYIYEFTVINKHRLWNKNVPIFRRLKWAMRQYANVITQENCCEICLDVTGIGQVYAELISKYWSSPTTYKKLAEKIVEKKVNDNEFALEKIKKANKKNKNKNKKIKNKIKKKKKKKKAKDKPNGIIRQQLNKRKQVPAISKEEKRKKQLIKTQQTNLNLFLTGTLAEITKAKRNKFCFILILLYYYYKDKYPHRVISKHCFPLLKILFGDNLSTNWHISHSQFIFLNKQQNDRIIESRTFNNENVTKHISEIADANPIYFQQISKYFADIEAESMDISSSESEYESSNECDDEHCDNSSDDFDVSNNKKLYKKRNINDLIFDSDEHGEDTNEPSPKKRKLNNFVNYQLRDGDAGSIFDNRYANNYNNSDNEYANIIDGEYANIRNGLKECCGDDCDWKECYAKFKKNKMTDTMLQDLDKTDLMHLITIMAPRIRFWKWMQSTNNIQK